MFCIYNRLPYYVTNFLVYQCNNYSNRLISDRLISKVNCHIICTCPAVDFYDSDIVSCEPHFSYLQCCSLVMFLFFNTIFLYKLQITMKSTWTRHLTCGQLCHSKSLLSPLPVLCNCLMASDYAFYTTTFNIHVLPDQLQRYFKHFDHSFLLTCLLYYDNYYMMKKWIIPLLQLDSLGSAVCFIKLTITLNYFKKFYLEGRELPIPPRLLDPLQGVVWPFLTKILTMPLYLVHRTVMGNCKVDKYFLAHKQNLIFSPVIN